MNKSEKVIFTGEIIHEHHKAEEQVDSRNRPQIVRPRSTEMLQKLKTKIQADSITVMLCKLGTDFNIFDLNTRIHEYHVILSNDI